MDDEYDALIKNKTWDLVPRPPNVNVIRYMWIFRHKEHSDGSFERHKVSLIGDGKTQHVGIDCGETFSLVVKPATIRIVLRLLTLGINDLLTSCVPWVSFIENLIILCSFITKDLTLLIFFFMLMILY
ncbi:hypothetical protein LIER_41935 [Lithospermum erythrorhizon]|uniref:Reverse transcriptase Ty1/copia-type domain-containing protein n=1 Tax=Lithospermum erythrorhizon TaxID=34254 RepID=A0AAV3RI93_LITER